MADVFISYSSKNADEAEYIREVLEKNNISCWIDHERVHGGQFFLEEILKGIENCKVLLIVLSKDAQKSTYVPKELALALDEQLIIIPYRIENCKIEGQFKTGLAGINYIDAFPDEIQGMTSMLEAVNNALQKTETEPVVPKRLQKKKKQKYIAAGAAVALLVLVAVIIALKPWSKPAELAQVENSAPAASIENTAKVYYSEVLPYTKAGFYDTLDSVSTVLERDLSVDRAFSILSFVRNFGDRNAMVEKISCEILDLQPIEEPVLLANGYFKENTLNLYLMNNGWGSADDVVITCEATPNADVPVFESIEAPLSQTIQTKIGPSEVVPVGKYVLDPTEVDAWVQGKGNNALHVCNLNFRINADDREFFFSCYLFYDVTTHSFVLDQGGKGDSGDKYSITLYGILDVDKRPDSIVFTGAEASPVISDTFRIETVIAPTKSCDVTCKGVYSVNGDLQESDTYQVSVTVPVFQPVFSDVGLKSPLMSEIAAADTEDLSELAKISSKYRYQPESIIENQ